MTDDTRLEEIKQIWKDEGHLMFRNPDANVWHHPRKFQSAVKRVEESSFKPRFDTYFTFERRKEVDEIYRFIRYTVWCEGFLIDEYIAPMPNKRVDKRERLV